MKSFIIAFAMYSKLPMPKVEWTKENMKYAMCFFPWVGAVIGIMYVLLFYAWRFLPGHGTLRSMLLCILPVLVTGGIHVDGFIDTIDARHSYQSKERKLEILKDPHVGAFAIIWTILYFFAAYGFTSELTPKGILTVALGFVLSRSLSGLGVVTIPAAKKDGLLVSFSSVAETKRVTMIMYLYIVLVSVAMLFVNLILGGLCVITAIAVYLAYKRMALKEFGGITGDLAGYFLQCCELAILITACAGEFILRMC